MALKIMSLLTLVLPLLSFLESTPLISPTVSDSQKSRNCLIAKIQEFDSKLAQLESDCEAKGSRIIELQTKVEGLNTDINRLDAILSRFSENASSSASDDLHALEKEVQLHWATSRKNNIEIHELEFRVRDAKSRLNTVNSQVEKMDDIVSHQWIQIQRLEQAVQMAKTRTVILKSQLGFSRCSFLKRIMEILEPYFSDGDSLLKSNISEALCHLKSTFAAVKHFHHQLQAYIQHSLKKNEFTAILAHEEVVFVMASALITFLVLSFFKLLFSHFA